MMQGDDGYGKFSLYFIYFMFSHITTYELWCTVAMIMKSAQHTPITFMFLIQLDTIYDARCRWLWRRFLSTVFSFHYASMTSVSVTYYHGQLVMDIINNASIIQIYFKFYTQFIIWYRVETVVESVHYTMLKLPWVFVYIDWCLLV